MGNFNVDRTLHNNLVSFGKKTVQQLKGTLPIDTGLLVDSLNYTLNDVNLSLHSTYYFNFVMNMDRPPFNSVTQQKVRKSKQIIKDNISDLEYQIIKSIKKEIGDEITRMAELTNVVNNVKISVNSNYKGNNISKGFGL